MSKECCFFTVEKDLSFLEGSVQWICQSPFRENHKRKNWFINVIYTARKIQI